MARWNSEKNELLKVTRHVSFEQMIEGYCYVVPYKPEPDGDIWLKTILCRAESRRENMEVSNVVF